MKKIFKITSVLLLISMFLVGCNDVNKNKGQNDGKLKIVTTIFPSYDFVKEIGGDNVEVKMLISPGTETHSYEPSPQDIISIQNSDLFIYVGGESDTWIDKILKDIDKDEKSIISLMKIANLLEEETSEGMEQEEHNHNHEEEEYDEHVWTSPVNSMKIVEELTKRLIELDSVNKENYIRNSSNYLNELKILDDKIRKVVLNSNNKPLVFADRFPFLYFVKEYNLDYFGAFPGCSEDIEASPATIKFLIDKVNSNDIPVVFYIEFSNEKLADIVVESSNAKKLLFNSAHNLSKDEFEQGLTYIDIMNENVENLKEALK